MTAEPLEVQLELQLAATAVAARKLGDKARVLKGAAKRARKPESKERARANYWHMSDLHEEAIGQIRSLRNLIERGRDDPFRSKFEQEWHDLHGFNEHAVVNVEQDSWARQQRDMHKAEKWLEDAELPEIELDMAKRIAGSAFVRSRTRERELFSDLLVSTKALASDYDVLVKKSCRQATRIKTLEARARKLAVKLEESRAADLPGLQHELALGKTALETTLNELDEAREEIRGVLDTEDFKLGTENEALRIRIGELAAFKHAHSGPSYAIVLKNNMSLTTDLQRLTRENARLEEHIDRISGR